MSITNIDTSSTLNLSALSGTSQKPPPPPPDAEGAPPPPPPKGHHGQGGEVGQALTQALQSLGLTTSTDSSQSTGDDQDSSQDSDTSSTVQQDMRQFMHALFEAARSASSDSGSTVGATSGTSGAAPSGGFASGLASVISQVSNGNAPSELQDAFNQLVSDLQGSGASGTSDSSTTPTLQDLLGKLQQNLPTYSTPHAASTLSVVA